jgi:hypothetical protein
LNGDLEEQVYSQQGERFDDGSGNVLKLKKALYGLKQAPRQWYKGLAGKMKEAWFIFCPVDAAVARVVSGGKVVWILFYVDDILVAATDIGSVEGVN